MIVPFLDLYSPLEPIRKQIDDAFCRVVESGNYLFDLELEQFELEWSAYVGATYAVGVGSGLDALTFSLLAFGVGEGDEVIVPSHTFIATWLAVSHIGANVIPVEPEPGEYNISFDAVRRAVTPKTKVIIAVHLYGQPASINALIELAKSRGIYLLEDAAQAHGASKDGKKIGAHGHAVAWSFYPGKNLGALADGGCVTTNDSWVADRIKSIRNYGSVEKYYYSERGFNSRLSELQAAILRVKLGVLDEWLLQRRKVAAIYLNEIRVPELILPSERQCEVHAWHLFVIRHERRDELAQMLKVAGVPTVIHYPVPVHKQRAYSEINGTEKLRIAESYAATVLSLPMGPHISESVAFKIAKQVNNCCARVSLKKPEKSQSYF